MSAAEPVATEAEVQRTAVPVPNWGWKRRLTLAIARSVIPPVVRLLGHTWRWDVPKGVPPGSFTDPPRPAVYVFWHRCLLPIAWFSRDHGFGVLVSQHFDGELISQVAERLGYRLFRGSSTRGGHDALQAMQEALAGGQPIALTVDGPRGPAFHAKGGAIQLAKMTGAPIYALHVSPRNAWTMKSWDRLQLPKPFSRVHGIWAGPMRVPAECGPDQVEALRQDMEDMLNQLRMEHDWRERKDKQ